MGSGSSGHEKWLSGPLQPVSPLFKRQFYCKEFSVAYIIVSFRWRQFLGEIGTGHRFGCILGVLGQDGADASCGGVHLHDEFLLWVWVLK